MSKEEEGNEVNSYSEVKGLLEEIRDNPELLNSGRDAIDILIGRVIGIEKKHLYQVESTSTKKRLEEIRKLLDTELLKAMET